MKKILLYMLVLLFCFSCEKKEEKFVVVTITTSVTDITGNSAVINGDLNFEKGKDAADINVVEKGFYYKWQGYSEWQNYNEFDANNKFKANYTGLESQATYEVQAYAIIGENKVRGNMVTFTTKAETTTTAQVRFRKTAVSPWTIITVDIAEEGGDELARHEFGTGTGTSSYFEIPAGNHKIWFYDNNIEKWSSSEIETFQARHKYTITIDEKSYDNRTYNFSDDGTSSSSDFRSTMQTTITVPKESLKELAGMVRSVTDNKLLP